MLIQVITYHKISTIDLCKNPSFNSTYFKKIFKLLNIIINILTNLNKESNIEKSNMNNLNNIQILKYFYTENLINAEILNEILSVFEIDYKTMTAFIMKFLKLILNLLVNILIRINSLQKIMILKTKVSFSFYLLS